MAMDGNTLGDAMVAAVDAAVAANPETGAAQRAAVFRALGAAIVAHIADEAVVEVSVTTADGGLQTSTAEGNPTDPPAATKTVAGTVS